MLRGFKQNFTASLIYAVSDSNKSIYQKTDQNLKANKDTLILSKQKPQRHPPPPSQNQ